MSPRSPELEEDNNEGKAKTIQRDSPTHTMKRGRLEDWESRMGQAEDGDLDSAH